MHFTTWNACFWSAAGSRKNACHKCSPNRVPKKCVSQHPAPKIVRRITWASLEASLYLSSTSCVISRPRVSQNLGCVRWRKLFGGNLLRKQLGISRFFFVCSVLSWRKLEIHWNSKKKTGDFLEQPAYFRSLSFIKQKNIIEISA